ncbi:PQQ-binding-like beta-propeller repeat protein [Thalassoglobus polymorphus]|uniref:Outer membrane biogenesis protein BamB n=1 Tax=Thalassoglobus polymorphus TaxID=2527994 RepID=A0A517QSJ1_9PLAN|nr:PQQ-binding-like beta-propeller repeat protein [Thalassoglobus polymorphus]QDT34557.1 outer membrane biogenesis protein BamB [Thalassoglobus polymorphus]
MTHDSTNPPTEPHPATPEGPSQERSRFGVFLKWMLIVFLVMQLGMRLFWDPAVGVAVVNLITYSQIALSGLLIILWWFCFSPLSRKVTLPIGLPLLIGLIIWLVSIRSPDFDGDMVLSFKYRWEKSPQEILQEYQQTSEVASTEKIEQVAQFSPEDVPAYRGIHRDGVVIGPELRTDWESNPPTELWRHPIGGGYSSFSIVDPIVITMEQRGKHEAVVSYDIETGNEFWEHRYPAYFNALGGPGPRSTPTIHQNAVYSFGCYGDLYCLDLKTGKPKWHVNVLQQFQLPTTTWGMTSSPLIHNDHVIVNIGGLKNPTKSALEQQGNGLVAYKLDTGDFSWKSEGLPDPNLELKEFKTGVDAVEGIHGVTIPGYSSPMLAEISGQEVILNFDGAGFRGNDPNTGKELWSRPFVAGDYINVVQPLVLDENRVMFSAGYAAGSVLLELKYSDNSWTQNEIWASTQLRSKFSNPVYYNGYIYGLDEGIMVCLDPKTGKRKWKGGRTELRGRYGHGQMLLWDDHIVLLTEKGDLVLIEPDPERLIEASVLKVLSEDAKTWNPLAIAYGKALVRNATEIACYDLRANPNEPSQTSENEVARTENSEAGSQSEE